MSHKISMVIEQDEYGCYAWCPELKGCPSQGVTVEAALSNIREAAELYLETLSDEELVKSLQQMVFTTAIEVHAYVASASPPLRPGDVAASRFFGAPFEK